MSRRSAEFFVEALGPIANSHRTTKQNGNLVATQRRLRREIARRAAVQRALEKSERHYSQLLERSRRDQGHLRRLSHGILSAQEEERKRISRELHDEIGQTLTAINVRLATLQKEATVNTKGLRRKIASTRRLLETSLNIVHRFARRLRPALLDDLGLIPALHSYMRDFTKRTCIPIHVKAVAAVENLNNERRTVLYRVAQEALTNVARHANASLVKVSLQVLKGVVRMDIHDNGKSFQVERVLSAHKTRRLGVLGMRERLEMVGGSLTVESAPGEGTTIRARVPLRNNHPGSPVTRVESLR